MKSDGEDVQTAVNSDRACGSEKDMAVSCSEKKREVSFYYIIATLCVLCMCLRMHVHACVYVYADIQMLLKKCRDVTITE